MPDRITWLEVPGAVKRFAYRIDIGPTPQQREILNAAAAATMVMQTRDIPSVKSPIDGRIIVAAHRTTYVLVRAVIHPELVCAGNSKDADQFRDAHPDCKEIAGP